MTDDELKATHTRGVVPGAMNAIEILTKDRDEWKRRALLAERAASDNQRVAIAAVAKADQACDAAGKRNDEIADLRARVAQAQADALAHKVKHLEDALREAGNLARALDKAAHRRASRAGEGHWIARKEAEAKVAELQALVDCATGFQFGDFEVSDRGDGIWPIREPSGRRVDFEKRGRDDAIAKARELAEKGRAK